MKGIKIGLAVVLAAAITCLAVYLAPSKTVDFSGEVTAVSYADGWAVLTVVLDFSDAHTVYTVPTDRRTRVFHRCREDGRITAEEIRVGDKVGGNYRWHTSGNAARYIQVE